MILFNNQSIKTQNQDDTVADRHIHPAGTAALDKLVPSYKCNFQTTACLLLEECQFQRALVSPKRGL